ncbi:MAG: hypothetical protein ABSG03_21485 [Bryobacteraceae bacterium]|jgi:hypothetical protein
MATPKQTAANRANAQNSSGPRTTAGKATSRFNALKHGIYAVHQIMFDEKPEDLAELAAEYHEHHRPADANQRFLVDTLVHNEWRIRRTRRVEANLWYRAYDAFVVKNIEVTLTCTSGDAFATDSYTFERLQRIVNSCERVYHRALKELQRLQQVGQALPPANPDPHPQQAAPAPPPQPKQSKPTSANLGSFRQNPKTPVPAAPYAQPEPSANPAETHPPAADSDPKPPEAA